MTDEGPHAAILRIFCLTLFSAFFARRPSSVIGDPL
jgi:hypothetical protein